MFLTLFLIVACDEPKDTSEETFGIIQISEASLEFGQIVVGESIFKTFDIQNIGTNSLTIYDIAFSNDNMRAHYNLSSTNGILQPNMVKTVLVTFEPQNTQIESFNLEIMSDDQNAPIRQLPIIGQAIGTPDIFVENTTINFGQVEIGSFVESQLEIANYGTEPLSIKDFSFYPDNFDECFSIEVSPVGTLPSGANNGLSIIRFTPIYDGNWYNTINITSNDPDTPSLLITLVAEGEPPT